MWALPVGVAAAAILRRRWALMRNRAPLRALCALLWFVLLALLALAIHPEVIHRSFLLLGESLVRLWLYCASSALLSQA